MNKDISHNSVPDAIEDEMLDEYDFSQATRGNPYRNLNQAAIRIQTRTGDRDVQIKTVEMMATIAPDGKVVLQLPSDITPGDHRITILIEENVTP